MGVVTEANIKVGMKVIIMVGRRTMTPATIVYHGKSHANYEIVSGLLYRTTISFELVTTVLIEGKGSIKTPYYIKDLIVVPEPITKDQKTKIDNLVNNLNNIKA